MDFSAPVKKVARFGLYEADLQECVLTKGGLRIRLQDQPFQVLAVLLDRPGQVVTREEIRQKLWPADTFVEFDDGLNNAIKKLRTALGDAADNPRFIETVPRRGYRFLAPVEFSTPTPTPRIDPDSRVQTSTGTTEQIILATRDRVVVDQTGPRRVPWGMVAAAILLLGAGGAALFYTGQHWRSPKQHEERTAAPYSPKPRHSVAVLGFRNLSRRPEEAWLSPALAEMLTTELAAGEQLRTVPGENVARTKRDLSLPDSDSYAKDTLERIHQNLGADFVVLGSYFDLGKVSGGAIRLDLRLQDARTGELVASVSKTGTEVDLPALTSLAGADLRQRMGAAELSKVQEDSLNASQPSNQEATRAYSEGLAKLRACDNLGGQRLLEKSISADPNFAPAHAALADALSALGYDSKARDEAEKAFDLSNSLSREQRMRVEARYREATREWDKAIDIYRALFHLFPDNIEYGLRLAAVQSSAGKGAEVLNTVGDLRKLPAPSSEDPRIGIAEAQGAESIGDYAREETAARMAAQKAQSIGASFLTAASRHLQCWALNRLGQAEQALAACEDARKIFAEAGDRDSVARVLVTSGSVLEEHGQFASAKARYEEALAIHRATDDQAGVALALNVLAVLNVDSGNYANAKTMYEQSTSIARKNGDQDAVILGLGNQANLLLLEGDLKQARPIYEDMLAICRRLDSKDRIALQLGNLGVLLFLQGDLSGAQKAFEESAALDLRAGNKRQLGDDLSNLGDVFQAQAKLPEARQKRSESLAVRTQITDKVGAANIRVAFAQSSIEEGHPTEAIEPLRQAIADLKELKSEDDEASTYPVLARALLLAGNPAEALKVIESGASVASKSRDRMVQFSFAIAEAQVKAANGQIASADESLTRIIAETKKDGFVGYELEARLALAEIQLRSARTATAQARLAAVEKDARTKGFLLIAHKAGSL